MITDSETPQLPAVALEAPMLPDLLQAGVEFARGYAEALRSAATRRAYLSDWTILTAWCDARGIEPLPASAAAVATFLASEAQAGVKSSAITRRVAAIGYMHRANGFAAPQQSTGAQAIRDVVAGTRRTSGVRKTRKRAADGDMLRDMLAAIDGIARAPSAIGRCWQLAWPEPFAVRSW